MGSEIMVDGRSKIGMKSETLSTASVYGLSISAKNSEVAREGLVHRAWWKEAVVYQVYPSSFCDSNGDGIGDLKGLTSKLDYLRNLGVDVVWLSPIYKSPLVDMGYDISDYESIDTSYGTLEDWNILVRGLHSRGMKLMMDLVVNHTSDKHIWFMESRSCKANAKSDWYIWRPAKYDACGKRMPPNNWRSHFQGSAWEWDETRGEYYLHLYAAAQPDLNWENPDVRNAIYEMMRLWFDRGTDGFRMDVINLISKVPDFPDAPILDPRQTAQPGKQYYVDGPRVHEFLQEMNKEVLFKYPHRITVGEAPYTRNMEALAAYVLPNNALGGRGELDMMFHFELMDLDAEGRERGNMYKWRDWSLRELKEVIGRWQVFGKNRGFWNSIYIENHDNPRSVSRFGSDSSPFWRILSAKMLAMMQVALSGTLYLYQGEEIGMKNVPNTWTIDDFRDVSAKNYYQKVLDERTAQTGTMEDDIDMSDVLAALHKKSRDNGRTPVQWDSSPNAGFTSGIPWINVNEDYEEWNVAAQMITADESVWGFWKKAIGTRKTYDVLIYGDFEMIDGANEDVFAFWKLAKHDDASSEVDFLVVLNFTERIVPFEFLIKKETRTATLLLGNYPFLTDEIWKENTKMSFKGEGKAGVELRGYEGRMYLMK